MSNEELGNEELAKLREKQERLMNRQANLICLIVLMLIGVVQALFFIFDQSEAVKICWWLHGGTLLFRFMMFASTHRTGIDHYHGYPD
jgi:O-antigen/teichoic acid export membrane protein